jgi:ABC-2 type transport system permease protein
MWAITKGSLKAQLRSPSSIIFGFLFPFIFIIIFGFIGGGGPSVKIAFDPKSDTANALYGALNGKIPSVKVVRQPKGEDEGYFERQMLKGSIAAIVRLENDSLGRVVAHLRSSSASADRFGILTSIIKSVSYEMSKDKEPVKLAIETVESRKYRTIDFILPGQLGFSLLSTGVFGIAFMFFNLRNNLILKRFYATPINRLNIVAGEVLARTIFQMGVTASILLIGRFFFGFTLVHGVVTFFEIMVLSLTGLMLFMGFGFIVSGRAKSDSSIPSFANLITMPQFLLGGTFFGVEAFPVWLQYISKILPLTHLNKAMREIAFEGAHLWDVRTEIGILLLWMVGIYAVAVRVFKWE